MKRRLVVLAFLVLGFAPSAGAGPPCSIFDLIGTWAFEVSGRSFIGTPGPGTVPFHTDGATMPGHMIGVFTVKADYTATGFWWATMGPLTYGPDPIPWQATLTIRRDCTGVIEYVGAPGADPTRERYALLDEGNLIVSIAWETPPFPTLVFGTTAWRIGHWYEPASQLCRKDTARGEWIMRCAGSQTIPLDPPLVFASAAFFQIEVGKDGAVTGKEYERVGPGHVVGHVTGSVLMNRNCTAASVFESSLAPPGSKIHTRAVLFDDGNQGVAVPLLIEDATGAFTPYPSAICHMWRTRNRPEGWQEPR